MPRMGDLADLTQEGMLYGPGPDVQPQVPVSQWPIAMRQAAAHPDYYEPQGTQWPQYPPPTPPASEPDRPNPLIPFSAWRSLPPKPRVGEIAAQQIVEQGPLGMGLGLAMGTGLKTLGAGALTRGNIGGVVASAEPSEAEAARIRLFHGSPQRGLKVLNTRHAMETPGTTFHTSNPEVADTFTVPREYGEPIFYDERGRAIKPGRVYNTEIDPQKLFEVPAADAQRFIDDTAYQTQLVRIAREGGHDAMVARDVLEGIGERYKGDVYAALDDKIQKILTRKPKEEKTATGFMGKILKPEIDTLMEAGAVPRDTYGNWMLRYTPEGAASMEDISGLTGNAFTSLKTGAPPDTMSRIVRGGVEPSQGFPVDFADLQKRKAEVVFGPTDRMYGGPALRQAGNTRFDVPIAQEGGINFPQLHADKHIPFMPPDVAPLYASVSRGAATKVNNIASEVLERGGQPWYAPVIMSHGGGDSAKQMAHTTHRALAQADLSEEAIAEINRSVRAKLPKDSDFPGYGKDLPEWLEKAGLGGRRAFVEGVDTGKVAKLTGVDVSQLRFANTDPRLHHTPSGSAGIVMGRMRPDVGVTNYPLHSNYPWAFMGQRGEIGGAPGNMPFSLFAPDMHRDLLKAGVPERFANQPHYYAQQGFPTGMNKTQPVTQEVVDNAGEWFRRYPQGWSIAAGAVPVMGALASEERQ